MPAWIVRGRTIAGDGAVRIMGILNVTPDSFSDGGRYLDPTAAVGRARVLVDDGAEILDIGGESSRPGSRPVPADEERRRVLPVVEAAAALGVPVSIDTAKPEVARSALAAGASIVNDIGGLRDSEMLRIIADFEAGAVVMHMAGTPSTMQDDPRYADVVREVADWLAARVEAAAAAGIPRERLAIDPGIGFGKTSTHNLELLRRLGELRAVGPAILVGTSRKRFLGRLTGRDVGDRLVASVVSALAANRRGADVVRVHDVAAMRDARLVWAAIAGEEDRP
jgi:dihydropteroate synthase